MHKRKEGLVIETQGCDSGCVRSAPCLCSQLSVKPWGSNSISSSYAKSLTFCPSYWAGRCFSPAAHLCGPQGGRLVYCWPVVRPGSLPSHIWGQRVACGTSAGPSYNGEPRSTVGAPACPSVCHVARTRRACFPTLYFGDRMHYQSYEARKAIRLLKSMSTKHKFCSFSSWWL